MLNTDHTADASTPLSDWIKKSVIGARPAGLPLVIEMPVAELVTAGNGLSIEAHLLIK